jgi:hypothetical protein
MVDADVRPIYERKVPARGPAWDIAKQRLKDIYVMASSFDKSEVEKSIEEAIHARAERQKVDNKETAAEIIAAISNFSDSFNDQRIKYDRRNKTKCFIDIAAVLLLFGTALFTGSSWWVFREDLHEIEKAYAPIKESADAAKASAEAAKVSAEAAKAAVELSTKTAERQLRAYVDIYDIGINIVAVPGGNDAQLVGVLVIKNFGATPSNDIEISTRTIFGKYPLGSASLPARSRNSIVTARLAPNQERKVNVRMEESAITAEQRAAWEKETIAAYFYGTVKYNDVFERACIVRFNVLKSKADGDGSRFASSGNNAECSVSPLPP